MYNYEHIKYLFTGLLKCAIVSSLRLSRTFSRHRASSRGGRRIIWITSRALIILMTTRGLSPSFLPLGIIIESCLHLVDGLLHRAITV